MTQCINQQVTDAQNEELMAPFTAVEIKEAMFSMGSDKSPRDDGFNPKFYQRFWAIVGNVVTKECLQWLKDFAFLMGVNHANIVLIPKKEEPLTMKGLHLIVLCQFVYKIVVKVLANRLKVVLPCIILETQSSLLPGRLITDNIIIVNEIAHWLKGKRRIVEGFAALKIDIAKAYDRLEWRYLEAVMASLGFCLE